MQCSVLITVSVRVNLMQRETLQVTQTLSRTKKTEMQSAHRIQINVVHPKDVNTLENS